MEHIQFSRKLEHIPPSDITLNDVWKRIDFDYYAQPNWESPGDVPLHEDWESLGVERGVKVIGLLSEAVGIMVTDSDEKPELFIHNLNVNAVSVEELQATLGWNVGMIDQDDDADLDDDRQPVEPLMQAYNNWLSQTLISTGKTMHQVNSAIFMTSLECFFRDTPAAECMEPYETFREQGGTYEQYLTEIVPVVIREKVANDAQKDFVLSKTVTEAHSDPWASFPKLAKLAYLHTLDDGSKPDIGQKIVDLEAETMLDGELDALPSIGEPAPNPESLSATELEKRYQAALAVWMPEFRMMDAQYEWSVASKKPGFYHCTKGWHDGYKQLH